eukprot:TRINITY_DN6195_c0_g2_i1.p1 TRINITY_DN6195_c0_g2~~TRINITY_DN6195_c0_g2_i1.p1  ORF type:complete len:302 (-),score=38.79 TRINITY_DN6195_c0_g2_i1:503-1408(-)
MGWHEDSTVKLVLGILGNISAVFLFLSPWPSFYRILKKGSTEDFSCITYVCTFVNCLLWTFYGLPVVKEGAILVSTINGFGVLVEGILLLIFVVYAASQSIRCQALGLIAAGLTFFTIIVIICLGAFSSLSVRSTIVGVSAVIFTTSMYAAPLGIMRLVIATQSVEFMPFYLSLMTFLNAVTWMVYAIYTLDVYISIPNAFGVALGAIQLFLYARYHNKPPRMTAELVTAWESEKREGKDGGDVENGVNGEHTHVLKKTTGHGGHREKDSEMLALKKFEDHGEDDGSMRKPDSMTLHAMDD